MGNKNPMFNRKQSESCKNIISSKAKERLRNKENHPLYKKGHSKETKLNMSLNAPGKNYVFCFGGQQIQVYNLRKF